MSQSEIQSNPAREWAAAIERGELDPEAVDIERLVEDDAAALIPELEQHLSDGQLERFEELQQRKIDRRAAENVREKGDELSDIEQEAIEALNQPADDDTATVELRNGVEVEVKTHTSKAIEDRLAKIDSRAEDGDIEAARADVIDALTWFIESDGYDSAEVWEYHIEEYGTASAYRCLMRCLVPTYESIENEEAVQKFQSLG